METEKLFYKDPFLTEFTATVLDCQPGKNGYIVTLDRTAFYPEGGGQPGDTGFLSGVRVTDTHERDGKIVHFCEQPLAVGQSVEGRIDYARRFEFMQLHSGEHILSGVIHRRFGYENVGSGLVTVMVKGDIGAVKAAVDSGVESAQRIGEVVTSLVIARPHNDINKIVIKHKA